MTEATPKALVFDLDGTLVDSLSLTFDAFNCAIEHFTGKRLTPEEIMKYFGRAEGPMLAAILGQQHSAQAYMMVRDYVDQNVAQVSLHAGVRVLLEQIHAAKIPVSIVTGRSWMTTEMILKHHRILDRFVTVVADDHVSQPKPSPEGLLLALSRMKVEPAHAMFVGDSAMDMRAAKSAGARGIAAVWDKLVKRELLEQADPAAWAETPVELWALWQSFAAS